MLGLATPTDDAWVTAALADVPRLLVDHAHCEMKAASNAMSLAVQNGQRPELVTALTALAMEELEHFRRVHAIIVARGIAFTPPEVDPYAASLRNACRALGPAPSKLVDRLLVACMIEARSCERFRILAERAQDPELRAMWNEFLASEAGHYRTFLDLAIAEGARDSMSEASVRARLRSLAEAEGALVADLSRETSHRATVHG